MRKAFVVAEVEIGLGAIVCDKDFAVLKRAHGARVDVQVRVEFHQVDLDPTCFQQGADGRRSEPLAERRHDTARYKDVLCRHIRDLLNELFGLCRVGTHKYLS